MKKLVHVVTASLLSLAAAAPQAGAAAAGTERAYLGGQAGMFLPIESTVSGSGVSGKLDYDPGLVLAAVGGYRFDSGVRGEAEFNFRRLTTDKLISDETVVPVRSDIWSCGLMGNVYYDFNNRTAVTPYVGAGVGLVVAEFGKATANGTTLWTRDKDLSFAYQGIAGFALRISRLSSLDFVYHHYAVPSLHFDTLSAQFRGINLSAGFRQWF